MTGYLLLTNGDASFARSGPLAMTRAADRRNVSAAMLSNSRRRALGHLPAGRVVEKARIGARASCGLDLGSAKRALFRMREKGRARRGRKTRRAQSKQGDSPPATRPAVSKPLRMPLSSNEV